MILYLKKIMIMINKFFYWLFGRITKDEAIEIYLQEFDKKGLPRDSFYESIHTTKKDFCLNMLTQICGYKMMNKKTLSKNKFKEILKEEKEKNLKKNQAFVDVNNFFEDLFEREMRDKAQLDGKEGILLKEGRRIICLSYNSLGKILNNYKHNGNAVELKYFKEDLINFKNESLPIEDRDKMSVNLIIDALEQIFVTIDKFIKSKHPEKKYFDLMLSFIEGLKQRCDIFEGADLPPPKINFKDGKVINNKDIIND